MSETTARETSDAVAGRAMSDLLSTEYRRIRTMDSLGSAWCFVMWLITSIVSWTRGESVDVIFSIFAAACSALCAYWFYKVRTDPHRYGG